MTTLDRVRELDELFIKQKLNWIANEYQVSTVGSDGASAGDPLCFVRQKRLKIREEINFYADEAQKDVVLRLKSKKIFEFRGRTEVQLPDGTVIGQLQKVFGRSLLRSSWEVMDAAGTVVATAQEQSLPLAILRRIWGMLPYVGDIPFFIPFHFDIAIDGKTVGSYRRPMGLADRYLLDLKGDPERRIDRRVAMAFTIALDALQDR